MRISLAHGDGGELSHRLITEQIISRFNNTQLKELRDAALLPALTGRMAVSTDSFVVKPLFFPGGDIGSLAVNGTVNDLAVCGARPLFLTLGLILEEGLQFQELERVITSVASAAQEAGVQIVAGDTKVVERGSCDKVYINTTGFGQVLPEAALGYQEIRAGDQIIVSGTVGDHGLAVLVARESFSLTGLSSDCAAVHHQALPLVEKFSSAIRFMRDPTRGGLATTLKEIAMSSGKDFYLAEDAIPLRPEVRAGTEMLGLDPLYLANEGKFCLVVSRDAAKDIADFLQNDLGQKDAAVIGEVSEGKGNLYLRTVLGATRELFLLNAPMLPRIC